MDILEFIKEAQNGDKEAMAIIIKENSPLIWSIVRKFSHRGYDGEDLFQIGAMGLMKCVERFDTSFGVKFSTYAVPMIMGEIKRFLRDDGMIKVSRSLKETAVKAKTIEQAEFEKTGIIPDVQKVAEIIDTDVQEVIMALESCKDVESIYKTVNVKDSEKEMYLIDRINTEKNKYCADDEILILREAVKKLEEKERKIIFLRYFQDKTQMETAKELGISQVQVSRAEKKILGKIREDIV